MKDPNAQPSIYLKGISPTGNPAGQFTIDGMDITRAEVLNDPE